VQWRIASDASFTSREYVPKHAWFGLQNVATGWWLRSNNVTLDAMLPSGEPNPKPEMLMLSASQERRLNQVRDVVPFGVVAR